MRTIVLPELAAELVDEILSYIRHDKGTLRSCAMAIHSWLPSIRRMCRFNPHFRIPPSQDAEARSQPNLRRTTYPHPLRLFTEIDCLELYRDGQYAQPVDFISQIRPNN